MRRLGPEAHPRTAAVKCHVVTSNLNCVHRPLLSPSPTSAPRSSETAIWEAALWRHYVNRRAPSLHFRLNQRTSHHPATQSLKLQELYLLPLPSLAPIPISDPRPSPCYSSNRR